MDEKTLDPASDALPWWRGLLLLGLIVVKLTLIMALRNRNVTEFIYAGF